LLEIEKTAVKLANMDRTEATPVVIEVCTETAELLNTTVLYAIIEEDAADRASLQAAYDGFTQWEEQRAAAEAALEAAEAIVTAKADALSECRITETETCVNETICTTETNDYCTDRDRVELELQEIDEEIHTSWCLEGQVRTSTEFRTTTVEVFHRYTEKLTELQRLQLLCDQINEHCETTLQTYLTKAEECNLKQSQLQQASCEYHHVANGALTAYQQGFTAALDFYNDVVARVMIEEADRKVEWDVLTRVICLLLTLTNEEDGVVSNGETEARIQRCWDDEVDVSHLDIEYLDPPPMLTLPTLPPLPCTAEHEDHYNLGPPAACTALVEEHGTQSNSECSCLADEMADQRLLLGHYLLVDPALAMTIQGNTWEVQMDQNTHTGVLSNAFTLDTAVSERFSNEILTDDQMQEFEADGSANEDYTGLIARIAWAYPSATAPAYGGGAMSLGERFATRGGLVFMNADGDVIDVRELASSTGTLGQPVANTLSFSTAQPVSDADQETACTLQDVDPNSRYGQMGALKYCWVMGGAIAECANGCFIYELITGGTHGNPTTEKVVFPVIDGMVTASTR